RYKAAARYDDLLNIELWVTDLDRVRVGFSHRIVNQSGTEILVGSTLHACTSIAEKPKRIPTELTEKLAPYLHITNG
ncbi:MAG: thioesterase, partial [Acidobacteria bacterium]